MEPNAQHEGPLAIIMAGGEGARLRPFTHVIPKPLLPIGRRPVAHIIIERLAALGFPRIIMTLEYGAELIQAYFRNGDQFGVAIEYHREPKKLGTAGCLADVAALKSRKTSFLLTNGDVLTDLDYADFLRRHEQSGAALTVATWNERIAVRYGVMRVENGAVLGVDEKPTLAFPINAGIYAVRPDLLALIPPGREFPMTDLINAALEKGLPVRADSLEGIWFDLSCTEDFEKATARLEAIWPEILQ